MTKKFNDVNIGDWGELPSGEMGTVIALATGLDALDKLAQYDDSGFLESLFAQYEQYGYVKEDLDTLDFVAVVSTISGETGVYVYSDEGFLVFN